MVKEQKSLLQGCVHGRFQPPHLEHLEYIRAALEKVDHLFIGIAQPDAPHLDACADDPHRAFPKDNPLTYVERCDAIEKMLSSVGIHREKYSFTKFPIDRPEQLINFVPTSVVCYTTIRDEWNLRKIEKLREQGYDVQVLWDKSDVKGISGTEIRKLMRASDSAWENHVHPAVVGYLNSNYLVDRIRRG